MRWIQESNRGRGFRSGGAHNWIMVKLHQYNKKEKKQKLLLVKGKKTWRREWRFGLMSSAKVIYYARDDGSSSNAILILTLSFPRLPRSVGDETNTVLFMSTSLSFRNYFGLSRVRVIFLAEPWPKSKINILRY